MNIALKRESDEIDRLQQIAQQRMISGPLIGLTGVAGNILGTIAFYGFGDDKVAANHLSFPGRISTMSGQAYALWLTPYTIIKGLVRSDRLRKRGELPSQQLEQRLKNLDALEAEVSAK